MTTPPAPPLDGWHPLTGARVRFQDGQPVEVCVPPGLDPKYVGQEIHAILGAHLATWGPPSPEGFIRAAVKPSEVP